MKTSMYIKLQKKFGGNWVSTNKTGEKVYASAENIEKVLTELKKKKISPQKTVIGFVEKYDQVSVYGIRTQYIFNFYS